MQSAEIRQWLRSEIEESEKALSELESRRNEVAKRLNALRVLESGPIGGGDDSGENHVGTSFQFTAAATFIKYGGINVPMKLKDIIGDGKGCMTIDGRDYPIGISKGQDLNGRPRLNGGVELKALMRTTYQEGELLELYINGPDRFSLFRVADGEGVESVDNLESSRTLSGMFQPARI